MIHASNGRKATAARAGGAPEDRPAPPPSRNKEQKADQWITENLMLGVSLALLLGAATGWLIKRQLL